MPRVSPQITQQLTTGAELPADLRKTAIQQTDQNNAGTQLLSYAKRGGGMVVPRGIRRGDTAQRTTARGIATRVGADRGTSKEVETPTGLVQTQDEVAELVASAAQYKGIQTSTGAPSTTQFPNSGDWGWYINTTPAPDDYWFVINNGGTVITPTISTLGGTITATQHSNFTASAANDNLHAEATAARFGFLSPTKWSLLDGALATATAASTLVLRSGSGNIDAKAQYTVNTHRVLIDPATISTWSAYSDTESRAAFNDAASTQTIARHLGALINDLIAHGILPT